MYDAAEAVPDSAYDIVYTGTGALCRLPDIVRWAETAASLVAPTVNNRSVWRHLPAVGWGRQHTLGDVVTAIAATGLRLDFLHEHDATLFRRFDSLERDPADGFYRQRSGTPRVPLMYSLRASRPSAVSRSEGPVRG